MTPPVRPIWFHHAMALATIAIWSFSFLFIVKLNRELSWVGTVVLRMDIYGVLLAALLLVRRPSLRTLGPRDVALLVGLSLVGGPLYHYVFSWSAAADAAGTSRIDPALLGLIIATVPVHAAWLGWLFLGERLGLAKIAALLLGLAGVATVLWGRAGGVGLLPGTTLEGPIGATISAVLGGGIVVLTRGCRRIYRPLDLVIVTGLLQVLWSALGHPWAELGRLSDLTAGGWVAAIFLGLFGLGVASLSWASALAGLPAVTVATYLFLASVLAAVWGWLFDGTPPGWPFVPGAALVLAGLLIAARGGGRRERPGDATLERGDGRRLRPDVDVSARADYPPGAS